MREQLIQLSLFYQGNYGKIKDAFKRNIKVPYQKLIENCVVIGDDLYPKKLYDLQYPPFVLYYRGELKLCDKLSIAVVGSRGPCAYSIRMTQKIVSQISQEIAVVSGLAKGIDTHVHLATTANHRIGVIACGLDIVYPKENRRLQETMTLVISEYPSGTSPRKWHFPWRNRLIAALGDSLYVMAAKRGSGTMHTVDFALELNRPIYVLAHHLECVVGQGCMNLIDQGAPVITNSTFNSKE